MTSNRFTAFADEDAVAEKTKVAQTQAKAAQAQQQPAKQRVVKVAKPVQHEDAHLYETVQDNKRGGRGGDRGGRGGRGGRGDRPQTAGAGRGGDRPRGERGGRGRGGRGDRPQTAKPQDGEVEQGNPTGEVDRPNRQPRTRDGVERRERGNRGHGRGTDRAPNENREHYGQDKQDGTGQANRERKQGGQRRDRNRDAKDAANEEQKDGEERPQRERRERKPREPREPREPKVEEEKKEAEPEYIEEGFTLDDHFAAKQAKSQGLLKTNAMRQNEKIDAKNIKDLEFKHEEMATTKLYKKADTTATTAGANANLLGFQAGQDDGDLFEARGGKRGGRGGDRGGRGGQQNNQPRGKRGGKIVVDDNEFPAL